MYILYKPRVNHAMVLNDMHKQSPLALKKKSCDRVAIRWVFQTLLPTYVRRQKKKGKRLEKFCVVTIS